MPRIPLVPVAEMNPEQRRDYDAMIGGQRKSAPVGPLAVAMHRPALAETMSALGLVLRFNSTFEPRLREFAILLTGRYWDCQFEWASHESARPGYRRRRSRLCVSAGRSSPRRTNRRSTITGWSC